MIGDLSAPATASTAEGTRQLARFLVVGALTWIVDTAVFLTLKSTVLDVKPVTAKVVAVVVATALSYLLTRRWSFRDRGGRSRSVELTLFVTISAIAVVFYGAPLWISRYVLQFHVPMVSLPVQQAADFIAAQVVGVLCGTAFRWWALRRFVFLDKGLTAVLDNERVQGLRPISRSVSVVIPTRNEEETIATCVRSVEQAFAGTSRSLEIIVVDDSDDATPEVLRGLTEDVASLRVLHRPPGRRTRGLGGAVMAGFAQSANDCIVVMDGDMQHPPGVAALLVAELDRRDLDICIASRYREGGSTAGLRRARRKAGSVAARGVVHVMVPATRGISDPCSGFFALRRSVLGARTLRVEGFKILVEVLARCDWTRCGEIPYAFADRAGGSSNFGVGEINSFARHMSRLAFAKSARRPLQVLGAGD